MNLGEFISCECSKFIRESEHYLYFYPCIGKPTYGANVNKQKSELNGNVDFDFSLANGDCLHVFLKGKHCECMDKSTTMLKMCE